MTFEHTCKKETNFQNHSTISPNMISQSLSQLIHSRWAGGNYDVLHISKWDEVPTINIIVLLIHIPIIFIFCQTVQFLLHL